MVRNARPVAPPSPTHADRGAAGPPSPRILIVEDDPVAAQALADLLQRDGHTIAIASDGEAALAMLDEPAASPRRHGDTPPTASFGLLLTDLNLPRVAGLDLLRQVRRRHRGVVPIVVTGFGRIDAAVEAVRLGAVDFLTKPIVAEQLRLAVRKAIHQHTLLCENGALRDRLRQHEGVGALVGGDAKMQRVFAMIDAAAATGHAILITGESGTGKTAVAHAIHRRAAALAAADGQTLGPMIRFAFGEQPEAAQSAALFGSSGGARKACAGRIAEAADGTLILEHLDRATAAQQTRLARLLEDGRYQRVGDEHEQPNQARLIFTTDADLARQVEAGRFREDLYFRLQPSAIILPPLRERRGDVRLLAEHFLARQSAELRKTRRLGDAALRALARYAFPGNVRELEQAIAHALMVSDEAVIAPGDLPESVRGPEADDGDAAPAADQGRFSIPALRGERGWTPTPLDEALRPCEKQILLAALQANDWNRSETARQLEINRVTLYKKIRAYKLDEPA
jgi:DNA-binding NtrC family response regulator